MIGHMMLLGVVVLYKPDSSVWNNIYSYAKYVDKLIIWKNSILEIPYEALSMDDKVIEMGDGENVGIGKALNAAVSYAIEHEYTHLLTMDQDSSFEGKSFLEYISAIQKCKYACIGTYAPNHGWNGDCEEKEYSVVDATITSGSVFPVSIFKELGMFRDDFFIDAIDTEFSYRLKKYGYKILCVGQIRMEHTLGNTTCFHIGRKRFSSINYPPLRIYYILRNHMIVRRMYPDYGETKGFYKFFLYRRFVQILLLESNKYIKLKAMFWGILHGFLGKTGPCLIKLG